MIRTVCGFIAQAKSGSVGAWVNLVYMNRLPYNKEIDALTENLRVQEKNVELLGMYAIYEIRGNHGNIVWQNKEASEDDMNMIYDYVLMLDD